MSDENALVRVTVGANSESFPGLAGKTVSEARAAFETIYNVAPGASATINGEPARDSDLLKADDTLVFGKPTAQKG